MNSVHDFGGMQGYGPVIPDDGKEPKFFHDWERRTFGVNMMLQVAGLFNADTSRHAMENIEPIHYLISPYYLHWMESYEDILVAKGIATREEMRTGKATEPLPEWAQNKELPLNEDLGKIVRGYIDTTGKASAPRKFEVGQKIRSVNNHPKGHTRLPGYARGRIGTITATREAFVYADQRAHSAGEDPQWIYSVRFDAEELWGADADGRGAVYLDLYEPYMQAL